MKQEIPEPVFLSAPKTANLCGVSRNTICCWIRDKKLASYRTAGGKYLIRPNDLKKFMEENKMYVPPVLEEIARQDERANQVQNAAQQAAPQTGQHLDSPSGTAPANAADGAHHKAVLIVDDEQGARALAVRTIQKMSDVTIYEAEDGYEALHLLTKHEEISLVLLDLQMPGMDGVSAYSQIRKLNRDLPVIIITGFPPDDYLETFGPELPDLLMTKPYQPNDLLSASNMFMLQGK